MKGNRWWIDVVVIAAAFAIPDASLAAAKARMVEIVVTEKGFEPGRVKVAKGEPLKLVVTRKTDATCAKEIIVAGENVRADLPLNEAVTIEFTPKRTGEIRYSCGMNMITGVLEVASSEAAGDRATGGMQGMGGMEEKGSRTPEGGTGAMSHGPCGCCRAQHGT